MTITQFNRDNLKTMRAEIDAALKAVGEKHGLNLQIGNIKFSANEFHTKLEVRTKTTSTGEAFDPYAAAWKRYCAGYGLPADGVGKTFTSFSGKKYTVRGINTKAAKYPVVVRGEDGKSYKFTVGEVKFQLGAGLSDIGVSK